MPRGPYVVAILTLDGEVAPVIAQSQGIEFTDLADLSSRPEIRALAQAAVDKANARLSRPEQVKAWELLPAEWTAESEELTPTLKLKRRVVNTKYADVVERLYAGEARGRSPRRRPVSTSRPTAAGPGCGRRTPSRRSAARWRLASPLSSSTCT